MARQPTVWFVSSFSLWPSGLAKPPMTQVGNGNPDGNCRPPLGAGRMGKVDRIDHMRRMPDLGRPTVGPIPCKSHLAVSPPCNTIVAGCSMVTAMASATECRQHAEQCRTAMAGASLSERLALNALAVLWCELATMTSDVSQDSSSADPPKIRLSSGAHFLP